MTDPKITMKDEEGSEDLALATLQEALSKAKSLIDEIKLENQQLRHQMEGLGDTLRLSARVNILAAMAPMVRPCPTEDDSFDIADRWADRIVADHEAIVEERACANIKATEELCSKPEEGDDD